MAVVNTDLRSNRVTVVPTPHSNNMAVILSSKPTHLKVTVSLDMGLDLAMVLDMALDTEAVTNSNSLQRSPAESAQ
jgi:hypothetical protein